MAETSSRNGFLSTLSKDDRTFYILRETVKRRRELRRCSAIRRTAPSPNACKLCGNSLRNIRSFCVCLDGCGQNFRQAESGLEPHGLAFSLRRKGCGRFGGSDSPPDCHSLPPHPPGYSPVGLIVRHPCGTIPSVFKEKNTIRWTVFFSLVAGVGLEPHDLRVMSPTSYQLLYPAIFFPRSDRWCR